jgi:hypothetical protein
MKESLSLGKQIVYQLGYSNFSFELWMILHKVDCNGPLTHRRQYLVFVNRAFGENFKGLNQFKKENNFARILKKMTLNDVRDAISRSRVIMKQNCINELRFLQHNGYDYCEDNPSLTIWESISSILETCKLSRRI